MMWKEKFVTCFVVMFVLSLVFTPDGYSRSLSPLGVNFKIAPRTGSDPNDGVGGRPAAAFDGTNFLQVWRGPGSLIRGARISRDGVVLDPAGITIGTGVGRPSVAFDGTHYLVVWAHGDVFGVRVTKDGVVVDSSPFQLTTSGEVLTRDISLAFDGINYLVAYRTWYDDVMAFRVSKDGVNLDGASGFRLGPGRFPWVAFDGTNYLVVWHTPQKDIAGNRVTTDGTVLDGNGFMISSASGTQEQASVAFGDTDYLVAWFDSRGAVGGYNDGTVRGTRVSTSSVVLDDPALLIAGRVRGQVPVNVAFDGTDFMVSWEEDHNPIRFRLTDVYGRGVSTGGELLGPVPFATSFGHQFDHRLAYGGDRYLAVWNESLGRCVDCVWGQLLATGNNDNLSGGGPNLAGETVEFSGVETSPWKQQTSSTNKPLFDIWGLAAEDAYAVGRDGKIHHYDGTNWSVVATTPQWKYGIWADATDNVWMTGWCRHIDRFDGVTVYQWDCYDEPSQEQCSHMGVWVRQPEDAIVVGDGGHSHRYDGITWNPVETGVSVDLNDAWGVSADDIYAVGEFGTLLQHDGVTWEALPQTASFQCLNGLWAVDESDMYAVGDWGTILHYDGSTWSRHDSGTEAHLFGVWGTGASDVYAVGISGTILHFDGESWEPESSGVAKDLYAVSGAGGRIWVVGNDGIILSKINPCADGDEDGHAICNPGCVAEPGDECGDCDDSEAGVYPGAPELCNGRDDDCEESTTDGLDETWYMEPCDGPDSDLCTEGEFDCAAGEKVCTDETEDTPEICGNAADDDCNGLIDWQDPECAKPPCPDGDGDDFLLCGSSCHIPSGKTCGDCDDGEERVNPSMPETCRDGLDNDCDGTADNPTTCFQLVLPADGQECFVDSPPMTFDWTPGTMEEFKVVWSSTPAFGNPKKTTGKAWLTESSVTLNARTWEKILKLGKKSGEVHWMVSARDSAGNTANSEARELQIMPAEGPLLTSPADGQVFAADSSPPTLTWEARHNSSFKVIFAPRDDLKGKPKASSGKGFALIGTSWSVPARTWAKVVNKIGARSVDGSVYYAVFAKDALGRRSQSAVRRLVITPGG